MDAVAVVVESQFVTQSDENPTRTADAETANRFPAVFGLQKQAFLGGQIVRPK